MVRKEASPTANSVRTSRKHLTWFRPCNYHHAWESARPLSDTGFTNKFLISKSMQSPFCRINVVKVYTAVLVHDKSKRIVRTYDTRDVRLYSCCRFVCCRRVVCVPTTCPHEVLWCCPLVHCCSFTAAQLLLIFMLDIAKWRVPIRTYTG